MKRVSFPDKSNSLILALLMLAIICTGCSEKSDKNGEQGNTVSIQSERVFYNIPGMMVTEKFALYRKDGLLRYFDTSTTQSIVYCFEPNCDHQAAPIDLATGLKQGEDCPAYAMGSGVVSLHDNRSYFFLEPDSLYRADRELKSRQLLVKINEPIGLITGELYAENEYFAAYCNEWEYTRIQSADGTVQWIPGDRAERRTCGVYRISLEDGTATCVLKIAEQYESFVLRMYAYDKKVYFLVSASDMPTESLPAPEENWEKYAIELAKHHIITVYGYDIESGSLQKILSDQPGGEIWFCDGFMVREAIDNQPAMVFRMNGEFVRDLDFDISGVACGDGEIVLWTWSDTLTYRAYEPESGAVLRTVTFSKDREFQLRTIIGGSCYGYINHGQTLAFIRTEDFWSGATEKAIPMQ